jgi:SAM-dependent methyltransferase
MTLLGKQENLQKILGLIIEKSPLQKKRLNKYFSKGRADFFVEADSLACTIASFLKSEKIPIEKAVDAYLKFCSDLMNCQRQFMKTGEYPVISANELNDNLYKNKNQMTSYMMGLGLSQFLWETHYLMYEFFNNALAKYRNRIDSYLEVGCGHGLFLLKAIKSLKSNTQFNAVDISMTSIDFTRSVIRSAKIDTKGVIFKTIDFLKLKTEKKYDFITMGEVLEHTDQPTKTLIKLRDLLSPNGQAFISTCVNCPAPDHVYHFRAISEIKEMIIKCGLTIKNDLILPVENLPMEKIIEKKITINYCAILYKLP